MAKGILGQLVDLAKAVASAARSTPPPQARADRSSGRPGERTADRPAQRTEAQPRRTSSSPSSSSSSSSSGRPSSAGHATAEPGRSPRLRREPAPASAPRYAPQADGDPDPGEVVWAWVPYEEDASRGKDRPVLVLDVTRGGDVRGLMLTSKDHAGPRTQGERDHDGRRWMDVGTGAWDSQRRPSEVRLDRVLHLPAASVRREGAALPRDVFERVVAAARGQQ